MLGLGLAGHPSAAVGGCQENRRSGLGGRMLFTLGLLQANDLSLALMVEQSIFTQLVWLVNKCWIRNCQMGIN